jgi:cytosine/adenosine deaminase-related metal-dependent hydrolase
MAHRKFKAEKLFDGYRFVQDKVLITDEQGTIEDIVNTNEAGDNIETFSGILSPGFINCHCHLELSHMRGRIPEKTGLVDFVLAVVQQRHFPEEEILQSIEKAESEMLANGIVAVGDICNNTLTIPQKSKGRVFYHNFIEASGYQPMVVQQRFAKSLEYFNEYARLYSIPVESNSITPHAPYSVAPELWQKLVHFPGNHLFTIHNQETPGENEWFMSKTGELTGLYQKMNIDVSHITATGKSSLQSFLPKFLKNQQVILVHNVHTTEEDLLFTHLPGANCKLYWCLCPNANLFISDKLPPVDLLIKHDCDIVFGTDSLASNHQLSILSEMKTIKKHFPHFETDTLLKWATSNGARAIQLDSLLGSFEKEKRPGILLIDHGLNTVKRIL